MTHQQTPPGLPSFNNKGKLPCEAATTDFTQIIQRFCHGSMFFRNWTNYLESLEVSGPAGI